jgi:hypothetical protein
MWLVVTGVAGAVLLVWLALSPATTGVGPPVRSVGATPGPDDVDGDYLDDTLEDELAERFAPIVFHGERETAFPTSVDAWLRRTHLSVIGEESAGMRRVQAGPLDQSKLLDRSMTILGSTVSSTGSRSRGKRLSFVLETVERRPDDAAPNPREWVTYVHSYPNESGGITLQYWRAYLLNDASFLGFDFSHGGDWEAVVVHLDPAHRLRKVAYLDHSGIVNVTSGVSLEGDHPLVWSEEGGHSSYADNRHSRSSRWFRHETWTGGVVRRWDDVSLGTSGGLRNVGEKSRPRNGQVFIQYSGLWGSTARLFMTSGYWGPAFNETGAVCEDGAPAYQPYLWRAAERKACGRLYFPAWCEGVDSSRLNVLSECFAVEDVR